MRQAGRRELIVLVVEPDPVRGDRLGAWLEGAGYGVMECPGPKGAGMVCLGQRGRACGLVDLADLLVLDLGLVPDAVRERTPGRRLLHYYLTSGKPVLLLGDAGRPAHAYRDDQVAVLRQGRGLTRGAFLEAIARFDPGRMGGADAAVSG